jgi:hypothetical protein
LYFETIDWNYFFRPLLKSLLKRRKSANCWLVTQLCKFHPRFDSMHAILNSCSLVHINNNSLTSIIHHSNTGFFIINCGIGCCHE